MAIVHDKLAERSASKANMNSTPTPLSKLPQRSRTPRLSASVSGIQVPATQASQASPLKESHTPQVDHQNHNNGDLDEESELKIAGAKPEFEPGDPKAELPFFNWKEFEQRYETAIKAASDKEDDLLEEFHNLTEAFQIWAESSSERDNDRAWKRYVFSVHVIEYTANKLVHSLKTRERYVQISEERLRDKKKHYVQVVEAFKGALKLFE
ncbi:hypothetical protein CJF31_00010690 [Rutstroemia sp. NJR-2017a BVV2]|nr:hypothetical protein CJF31_00010690 [Rutstroemia sp. NJR-2017a BVV2]